jgi:hypothetical protein
MPHSWGRAFAFSGQRLSAAPIGGFTGTLIGIDRFAAVLVKMAVVPLPPSAHSVSDIFLPDGGNGTAGGRGVGKNGEPDGY